MNSYYRPMETSLERRAIGHGSNLIKSDLHGLSESIQTLNWTPTYANASANRTMTLYQVQCLYPKARSSFLHQQILTDSDRG